MKVRGSSFTTLELLAKLRSMSPEAYLRNAKHVLRTPERRLLPRAIRYLTPSLAARLAGRRHLGDWLAWARSEPWPVPEGGREHLRSLLLGSVPNLLERATEEAEATHRHEFDLLGSGPVVLGPEIDWLCDFKTGCRWALGHYAGIDYSNLGEPSDVKVPWELSRCHHLVGLARAHLLAPSPHHVEEIARQLRSWIDANPVGKSVNWSCTMEVAIRSVNMVWTLAAVAPELDDDTLAIALTSLVQHALFIERNLEVSEVAGNHYISDALGLVVIGAFLRSGRSARRWLDVGGAILESELYRQVYDDGVDHEMSIPYHRLVTEIFVLGGLALRSAGHDPDARYWRKVEGMVEFVAAYTRPDGSVPVWGDADDGRVLPISGRHLSSHDHVLNVASVLYERPEWIRGGPSVEDAAWLLGALPATRREAAVPSGGRSFPQGGFAVLRSASWHVLFDAGPVGLRGRGGHGHNDALAVEVWCEGPLVVDPGSYVYTADAAERMRFRSTAAHNTPVLGALEINDQLGMWQLADQARAHLEKVVNSQLEPVASGAHHGYERFDPAATVRRRVALSPSRCVIDDEVANGIGAWTTRWTFDRGFRLLERDGHHLVLHNGRRAIEVLVEGADAVRSGSTWVSPSYGVRTEALCLDVEHEGPTRVVFHAG